MIQPCLGNGFSMRSNKLLTTHRPWGGLRLMTYHLQNDHCFGGIFSKSDLCLGEIVQKVTPKRKTYTSPTNSKCPPPSGTVPNVNGQWFEYQLFHTWGFELGIISSTWKKQQSTNSWIFLTWLLLLMDLMSSVNKIWPSNYGLGALTWYVLVGGGGALLIQWFR